MDDVRLSKSILMAREYHAQSCCTFVLLHIPGTTWINRKDYDGSSDYMLNGFAVGWVPHGHDKLPEYIPFKTYHSAYMHYMAYRDGKPPPKQPYTRDFQRQLCYDWEASNIKGGNRHISSEAAQELIGKICAEFNLVAPKLNFKKGKYEDYAFFQTNRHEIGGDWRMLTTANIVHEAAHLVDIHIDHNDFVTHGPSFVKRLIELSARYIPSNDEDALLRSAQRAGLLGLPAVTHSIQPAHNPVLLKPEDAANDNSESPAAQQADAEPAQEDEFPTNGLGKGPA